MVSCKMFGIDQSQISCCFQKALQQYKNMYFYILLCVIQVCFLLYTNGDNSNNKKTQHFLMSFLIIMWTILLLQENADLCLKSLKD